MLISTTSLNMFTFYFVWTGSSTLVLVAEQVPGSPAPAVPEPNTPLQRGTVNIKLSLSLN